MLLKEYKRTDLHQRTVDRQTFIESEGCWLDKYLGVWLYDTMRKDTLWKRIVDSDDMPCPSQPREAWDCGQSRSISAMQ